MQAPIETPVPTPTTSSKLTLAEFTKQFSDYSLACAFFRERSRREIEALQNDFDMQISQYGKIIATVNEQIALDQNRLKDVEYYGEDGASLKSRISNQIGRQNKYVEGLKSQCAQTKSLKFLFSLTPDELVQEAVKEKSSALLIVQTPELMAAIPNTQIEHISHQDSEIVKSLALVLLSRDYTFEVPNIYAALKKQAKAEPEQRFIVEKENQSIHKLLVKMNKYLDKKIDQALKTNTHPWNLGYFGSRYKLKELVSVPQGIYELKTHLDQLDKTPPKEILSNIQTILHTKVSEIHDESFFQRFKRFVSYLLGYYRSPEASEEYEHLEQVSLGRKSV